MVQRTQEGDFSDCCDGRAIALFRGIDPDCLECYDFAGAAVSGTAGVLVRKEAVVYGGQGGSTRLLQTLKWG